MLLEPLVQLPGPEPGQPTVPQHGLNRGSPVGDRPIGFLEAYAGQRSLDYPFGILQLELKKNSKGREEGTGALLYSAKIKVLEGNSIDVESYGISPIRLLGVRKL